MDASSKSIKILAVDDSEMIRNMVSSALYTLGYNHIDLAEDGLEALNRLSEDDYDFIITDINMPNMNGFELIEELRNKLDYMSTPIMVLTTEKTDQMKQRGRKAGATSWIVKPINIATLRAAIPLTINKVQEG